MAVSGKGLAGVEDLDRVRAAAEHAAALTHDGQAVNFRRPENSPTRLRSMCLRSQDQWFPDGSLETDEEQKLPMRVERF